MNNFKLAARNVLGGKRSQLGKILFLGAGLAAGLMLLTKVWFEYSFEGFYPDAERICLLRFSVSEDGEEMTLFNTSGGIAPWFKERVPMIESATRYGFVSSGEKDIFFTGQRQRLAGTFVFADENLFEVLPRPVTVGDAGQVLSAPMQVLISQSLAKAVNGDPVGQTIELNNYPGRVLTIGGVFEDIPENTLFRYDAVISISSLSSFMYDGSENLNGNERYKSFVKLYPGTSLDQLNEALAEQYSQTDIYKLLQGWGVELQVFATYISDLHKNDPGTRRTTLVLLILAASIIFATVFNYLLVVLSDTVARGREIAVMKCHGAGFREIARRVMAETSLQLLVMLLTAGVLVVVFSSTAEQVLGTSLAGLLTWRSGLLLLGVVLVILFVSTYIQAKVYNNIPVASVFRSYRQTSRKLKLALLFVQVAAVALLAVMLVTVIRQYDAMVNDDPGYDYENLLVCPLQGVEKQRQDAVMWEVRSLDVVDMVAGGWALPYNWASGNNVSLPGVDKELFNINDFYYCDENYLPVFGIEVIEGRNFSSEYSREEDMMVSRSFVERMKNFTDWDDGIVGRMLMISGHGSEPSTITGVFEDFKVGTIGAEDTRPTVLFYSGETQMWEYVIKMREMGYEPIARVKETIERMLPDRDITLSVYGDLVVKQYEAHLLFRKSITIASIIVMVIVLVGLVGYVRDETSRREKEIAIRKINGASVGEILAAMTRDIAKIMLPAMIIGVAVAYYVAGKWMQEFSVKVAMHWWITLLCVLILSLVAVTAVALTALRVAYKNPAESLKTE